MLSEVIAEVSEYGHANISDPYGGPYLAKVWVESDIIKLVRVTDDLKLMLLERDNWDDIAWHFQTKPKVYPYTRPFPFYIGKE